MSGSSRYSEPVSRPRHKLNVLINQMERQTQSAEYNSTVSQVLKQTLVDFNSRDVEAVKTHLEEIKKALSNEIAGSVDLRFGGSVTKHTYADGLSDVDVLVSVENTELANSSPKELLAYFKQRIQQRLPRTKVETGQMAVTISYSNGIKIQVLPSLKLKTGIRVPSETENSWSKVVRPHDFAKQLTQVNTLYSRNVVPVIKLFKGAQLSLPKNAQLSGYHIESLAVNAFKNYSGSTNLKEMLTHLCQYTATHVKTPIADKSGQSLHVDDSFGAANSEARLQVSHYLSRLLKRVNNADLHNDPTFWKNLYNHE